MTVGIVGIRMISCWEKEDKYDFDYLGVMEVKYGSQSNKNLNFLYSFQSNLTNLNGYSHDNSLVLKTDI